MVTSPFARGVVAALAAALLFGVGAPAAKWLVADADPIVLSAILYLGAGVGLTALRFATRDRRREAALRRDDAALVVGMTLAGGVLAPLLLLAGLRRVSAVTGSLLLNLEGALTVTLAVAFFGDHLGGRAAAGVVTMLLGAATLGLTSGGGGSADLSGGVLGVLAVSGACLGWAIDNNLTQRLSVRDPLAIAQVKGLLGGSVALALAVLFGRSAPPAVVVGLGFLVGFVSYGLSVALAVYAMREIGVAREAALFAAAPFLGVGVSVVLLHEAFGLRELVAMLLMLTGLGLLATERHSHRHVHEPMRHDHRHVHDAHHRHAHAPGDPAGEPHAHEHTHTTLEHDHPHAPDAHHRHH
jgi:drug/metabolite transporter (DMT)-like permease